MRRTIFALCAGLVLIGTIVDAGSAEGERSLALVLDASGSMNAKLPDGGTRIAAAKSAVEQLLGILAPDTRLSLRVYGHQSSTRKKDCMDSELVTGFESVTVNRSAILERTKGIKAQGYTLINYSLQRAAEDIGKEEAAERIVVLVSDGKETCEGDPCATAQALANADARLAVHTIGFGVDTVTRQQLECIARVARGKYFDAANASDLAGVLSKAAETKAAQASEPKRTVITIPKARIGMLKMEVEGHSSHDVVNAAGETVATLSSIQRTLELPPGIYSVKFGNGVWTGLEVKPDETTEVKPGFIEVNPSGSDFVYVLEPETGEVVEEILYSKTRATLIPGRFDLRFGKILWPGGVELKPGETTKIRPAILEIESKLPVFRFVMKDAEGQVVDDGDSFGKSRLALPSGKYALELDPDKWIKTIPDERRVMEVELTEGEEIVITVE